MNPETFERIRKLEGELQLPDNFFLRLSQEDDWSFIIKLHSLIEAAVTSALIDSLGDKRLEDVVSSLQLGHRKTGKLAFVTALELLDKFNIGFITRLSELRNTLIHQVSNVNFNLKDYVNKLSTDKLNEFVQSFGIAFKEECEIGGIKRTRKELVEDEGPKITIWLAARDCLEALYIKKQGQKAKA